MSKRKWKLEGAQLKEFEAVVDAGHARLKAIDAEFGKAMSEERKKVADYVAKVLGEDPVTFHFHVEDKDKDMGFIIISECDGLHGGATIRSAIDTMVNHLVADMKNAANSDAPSPEKAKIH